jgi:hypothetical protein
MNALDEFWETLSFLLRPGDPEHNNGLVRDFAKMSGISETIIREKLAETLRPNGATQ